MDSATKQPDDVKPLTARQQKGMEALLRHGSVASAARASKIPVSTLFFWLREDAFKAAYDKERRRLFTEATDALQKASMGAVGVLCSVMADTGVNAAVRVSAARSVLEFALRAKEATEIDDRLAALEEAFATGTATWRATKNGALSSHA